MQGNCHIRTKCVGREEIRGDKIHRESFLNSLKEIARRSKFRGSKNAVRSRLGQGPADCPVVRRAQCAQAQPERPPD